MIINIQFMKNRCSPEKNKRVGFPSRLKVPHELSTHWKYHMNSVHTESTTWTQYTLKVPHELSTHWKYKGCFGEIIKKYIIILRMGQSAAFSVWQLSIYSIIIKARKSRISGKGLFKSRL